MGFGCSAGDEAFHAVQYVVDVYLVQVCRMGDGHQLCDFGGLELLVGVILCVECLSTGCGVGPVWLVWWVEVGWG
jgi:hypothetical protein